MFSQQFQSNQIIRTHFENKDKANHFYHDKREDQADEEEAEPVD